MNGVGRFKKADAAFAAALRRADNPDTEYQSWEYLAPWIDLEKPWERLPYATVAASLARIKKASTDGSSNLGKAIALCYQDGNTDDQAKAKLRRLLACDSSEELCTVLRPLLRLMSSRGVRVCHADMLHDLIFFNVNPVRTKTKWAQDFFGKKEVP